MTPAALKQAVLEELGVVPAGGPYPADEIAKVTEKYTGLHAQMLAKNLVTWALTESIPAKVQDSVVSMLTYACAKPFGIAEPRYSRMRSEGSLGDTPPSLAERQVRQVLGAPYVSVPALTEYF